MKILILIFTFFIICSCFNKNQIKPNIYLDSKFVFYTSIFPKCLDNGWASVNTSIINKQYKSLTDPDFDNLWFQGLYGIYLGLDFYYRQNNINYIQNYLDGVEYLLKETDGIYLRDNTKQTFIEYYNGRTSLEASKDQMIGFISGMFMLYYYCPDKAIRTRIKNILRPLYVSLIKHQYMLYNNIEKRNYDSAYYLILHYYGVSKAMSYIFNTSCSCISGPLEKALTDLLFEGIKYKRRIISKELMYKDINLFNLPILTNYSWYNGILKKDEFSINLSFYELVIGVTLSKSVAQRTVDMLENEEVAKLKHLNLAALYFYCNKVWNINLNQSAFYRMVLSRDNYYYPINIPPNSFKLDSDWTVDTINLFIQRDFTLSFPTNWYTPVPDSGKSIENLEDLSFNPSVRRVDIDCGIPFLMRYLMSK